MRKPLFTALIAIAFTLPLSCALAAPQHGGDHGQGGGHTPPSMPHMNNDAHGDAVATTAHSAKANHTNVGKAVSPVARSKNRGHGWGHGKHHGKSHHNTHHKRHTHRSHHHKQR